MNLGKKGASFTFGGKGFKTTFSGERRTTTIGIPGTGLSYTTTSKGKGGKMPPSLPKSVSAPAALFINPTASPPPLPDMPKQPNYGNWLAVFFACVAAVSIFGRCSSSPTNTTVTTAPTPEPAAPVIAPQTRNTAPPPVQETRSATPATIAIPSSIASASSSHQSAQSQTFLDKPKVSIENFKPKTVKLTQDVDMPLIENKKYIGSQRVPAGTVVNLKVIKGDSLILEYNDGYKLVPVSATDLLDQMVAAVGD